MLLLLFVLGFMNYENNINRIQKITLKTRYQKKKMGKHVITERRCNCTIFWTIRELAYVLFLYLQPIFFENM